MGNSAKKVLPEKRQDDAGSVASVSTSDSHQAEANQPDYIDPPMPIIGEPLNIHQLVNRNKKMREICFNILDTVSHDSRVSMVAAKTVPVSDSTERVLVTEEVTERMRQHTTKKAQRVAREGNINEIQKALALRRNAHVVMNENYSKVLVNPLEPIFINEARSEITHPTTGKSGKVSMGEQEKPS